MIRSQRLSVPLFLLLGSAATLSHSSTLGFPPGPRPVNLVVSGSDVKIQVKVKYDPGLGNKTFLNSGGGLLARVYLIDPETEVAHWLPLSEVHVAELVAKYEDSKNDITSPPHEEVQASLIFTTEDHEGLKLLEDETMREVILRLPFGTDTSDAKEEWETNTVPVTVT